jgi:hypothetical protein
MTRACCEMNVRPHKLQLLRKLQPGRPATSPCDDLREKMLAAQCKLALDASLIGVAVAGLLQLRLLLQLPLLLPLPLALDARLLCERFCCCRGTDRFS